MLNMILVVMMNLFYIFLESFFKRKLYLTLYFLSIAGSFSLDISGKTISLITYFVHHFAEESLMVYFIIDNKHYGNVYFLMKHVLQQQH